MGPRRASDREEGCEGPDLIVHHQRVGEDEGHDHLAARAVLSNACRLALHIPQCQTATLPMY